MYIDNNFENPFLELDETNNQLLPLNIFVDFQESKIDTIPAIRESVETVAGLDGDILYDSTYSPRLFDLVCYTPDNLSAEQKILYKQHITYTLNQLKTKAKPLLYQGKVYMVRLTGTMQPSNYAGWFNGTIQLKASDPFGYSQLVYILKRDGVIRCSGNVPIGLVIEIQGETTNPFVTINGVKIAYNGTVPLNTTLSIDTENQQAFLINADGIKTNAINNVTGLQKKVQLQTATTQIINELVEFEPYKNTVTMSNPTNTTVKWREKYL